VCHVFTDDLSYQQRIQDQFRDEVKRWQVTMGPPTNDPQSRSKLRSTSLRDSVTAFWAMSCCLKFVGTSGSSVTPYVANVNSSFRTRSDVGDYWVATKLTRDAHEGLRVCVQENFDMLAMTAPTASNVNTRQYGILHFLTHTHLWSIYTLLKEATSQQPINIAVWNKNVLFEKLKWAKENQKKFKSAFGEGSRINWFTAVIEIRLNPWVKSHIQDVVSTLVMFIYIYMNILFSLPRLPPSSLDMI